MRRSDKDCVVEEIHLEVFDEQPIEKMIEHLRDLQTHGFTHVDWEGIEFDRYDPDPQECKMYAYRARTDEEKAEQERQRRLREVGKVTARRDAQATEEQRLLRLLLHKYAIPGKPLELGAVVSVTGPGCSRLLTWTGETEIVAVVAPPDRLGDASFYEWHTAAERSGIRMDYPPASGWHVRVFTKGET